jgi:hypothetical protein
MPDQPGNRPNNSLTAQVLREALPGLQHKGYLEREATSRRIRLTTAGWAALGLKMHDVSFKDL